MYSPSTRNTLIEERIHGPSTHSFSEPSGIGKLFGRGDRMLSLNLDYVANWLCDLG